MPTSPHRFAFIMNPQSGNGRAGRQWSRLETQIRGEVGDDFKVFETSSPGHATALTHEAIAEGYDRVVSCGGDGTHFEVVNGFFENDAPIPTEAAMALLPLGTGSDLPRTLNIPRNPEKAIPFLNSESVVLSDVARIDSVDDDGSPLTNYFLSSVHIGFGGAVCEQVNQRSKVLGGFLTFLLGTIRARMSCGPELMRVRTDNDEMETELLEVIAANGQWDGGGMHVAPHALLNSGELEIYTMPALGVVDSLVNIPRLYKGTQDLHPMITRSQSTVLEVESDARVLSASDGEITGRAPLRVSVVPMAVRLVTGPDPPVVAE